MFCEMNGLNYTMKLKILKNIIGNEHFFYLKMHGNWSFQEAYNLPIGLRNWFVNRLSKYFEDQNREMEKSRNKAKGRH